MAGCFKCHVREDLMFMFQDGFDRYNEVPTLVLCKTCWGKLQDWILGDQ